MSHIQIVRYPNRRLYARAESRYVSLEDIEQLVQDGETVEIRDSQSEEDLTRSVLTRILLDRHPDKMRLFPVAMLHAMLRSNELMADFLRDYFRHSLTYLDFLQRHNPASSLARPMHWVKAWLDGIVSAPTNGTPSPDSAAPLTARIAELEQRIRQLEAAQSSPLTSLPGQSDAGNH